MLIKIMLTALIFFVLSLVVCKYQKDTHGECGDLPALICVGSLFVWVSSFVLHLLMAILL